MLSFFLLTHHAVTNNVLECVILALKTYYPSQKQG